MAASLDSPARFDPPPKSAYSVDPAQRWRDEQLAVMVAQQRQLIAQMHQFATVLETLVLDVAVLHDAVRLPAAADIEDHDHD
jgi:hypothetical protein